MADVARGSVLLTPKFDNLTASITRQLSGAFKSADGVAAKAGSSASVSMGSGFLKTGGLIGAASALTSKAFDAISASMGSAINRVDTMANFPKVMVNLGYTAGDAQRAIDRMSEAIDGMPTSLDSITGMVQQLAPLTGGMDEATSIGIAFNNALLAGGASAFDVSRAMQQYTQMLSKGKPELQDWKTLQEVMPGQLNQIAQALLGPTAKGMDLYNALKKGNVSMDDFNAAMVRLSGEGVNGFASFEEQARTATGGIGTAMTNVQNRIAKAVAKVVDSIGQANISGAINSASSKLGPMGDAVAGAVTLVRDNLGTIAPAAAAAAAGFAAFNALPALAIAFSTVTGAMTTARTALIAFRIAMNVGGLVNGLSAGVQVLGSSISAAFGGPIGVAIVAIAALAAGLVALWNTNEGFRGAVTSAWRGIQAAASAVWPEIQAVVTAAMGAVRTVVGAVLPVVQALFQVAGSVISAVVSTVFPVIRSVVTAAMNAVRTVVSAVLPPVQALFSSVFGAVSAVVTTSLLAVSTIVTAVLRTVNAVITGDLGSIRGIWAGAWNAMRGLIGNVWNGIRSGVSSGISALMSLVSTIPGRITGLFAGAGSWLLNAGASIINGLKRGISSAIGGVISMVKGAVGKIRDFFPFSPAKTGPFSGRGYTTWSGRALITDFGASVRKYAPAAAAMVEGAMSGIREAASARPVEFAAAAGAGAYGRTAGAAAPPYSATARPVSVTQVFNQPVQSPDQLARVMRMQEHYGIAAGY